MKYNALVPVALLSYTVALPTASNPSLNLEFPSTSSCINGTANTVVKTIDNEDGSYQMIHTLDNFQPAQLQANIDRCSVEFTIGVPPGYRARANKDGVNVAGYIHLEDEQTSAEFSSRYSFASAPFFVSSFNLRLIGPFNGEFSRQLHEQDNVVQSTCDGDILKSSYELKIDDDELVKVAATEELQDRKWVITGGLEILKCQ